MEKGNRQQIIEQLEHQLEEAEKKARRFEIENRSLKQQLQQFHFKRRDDFSSKILDGVIERLSRLAT